MNGRSPAEIKPAGELLHLAEARELRFQKDADGVSLIAEFTGCVKPQG